MAETNPPHDSSEATTFQGDRTASITPQGQALNQSLTEEERVKAVTKTPGKEALTKAADANRRPNPALEQDVDGGFGMVAERHRPADLRHKGGDPRTEGNAQYGASPLRGARYAEDHRVNDKHFADGKPAVQGAMHKGPAPDTDR